MKSFVLKRIVYTLAEKKFCSPECRFFRCEKRATVYRRDSVWCKWIDDECNVVNCSYVTCGKRRLLPNGICGETVKRKTVDKQPEEELSPVLKLRGKTLRRIGDREIF